MIRGRAYALLLLVATTFAFFSCSKSSTPTKPPVTKVGSIEVFSTPAGASIALDGTGTSFSTPDTLDGVPVGSRLVGLSLTGYADSTLATMIAEGVMAHVNVTLRHLYVPPPITFLAHTEPIAAAGPVEAADFTSDGHLDLVVGKQLLIGVGDGTFTPGGAVIDTTANLRGMTTGDFDHDGKADIALLLDAFGNADLVLFLGNGNGTFHRGGVSHFPYSPIIVDVGRIRAGDLNGDGASDVVIGYRTGSNVIALGVWRADGLGSMLPMVEYTRSFGTEISGPSGLAFADFNHDGAIDVAEGLYTQQLSPGGVVVWRGTGAGALGSSSFVEIAGLCQDLAVADLNGDGHVDIATADAGGGGGQGSTEVLLGRGDGSFRYSASYPTGLYSTAVAIGDFNSDSRPDLAVVDNYSKTVSVLAGYGDGAFKTREPFATSTNGVGIVGRAFDADSRPDLAIVGSSDALEIFLSR